MDVKDGKMTGEVESVLFKGVHYEIMVETVPGTHVTVNMHVNKNYAITSEDGKEKISANDLYLDLEDMKDIDDLSTLHQHPLLFPGIQMLPAHALSRC